MDTPDLAPGRTRNAAGAALVPTFIALELFGGLIQGWITPLLGVIGTQYQVPGGALSWILTVGLLSSAVSVPLMTMLADRFGGRRLLVIAVALSAIGSTLIAIAPSFAVIIIGSIVQGPVAAMLPIEMSLLKHLRPTSATKIIGVLVGTLTFGVALGSLGAGLVMDAVGDLVVTQLIGAAPLVVLAIIVGFVVPRVAGDSGRVVDWAGATTLGLALVGLMYGLSEGSNAGWLSPITLGSLALGVVALVGFVIAESRATTPLFDVKMIRRARLGVPLLLGVFIAMTLFGSQTPTVLYLGADPATAGYGVGVSTSMTGIVLAVTTLFATIGSFVAPLVTRAIGVRLAVAVSCLVIGAGQVVLMTAPSQLLLVIGVFAVTSLGTGVVLAVLPGVVIERAPESASASVSGLYNSGRTLGGSLAGAFVASVMTAFALAGGGAEATAATPFAAFQVVWGVFAALLLVAAVLALFLTPSRRTPAPVAIDESIQIGAAS
ncbi:MFS transporter [Agromyces sp. NPDC058104]|uniref:MFS transporter n=1 Tax=Agromyces sp. NPDC058104 TaxID=3346342 RepID=UPI0036DD63A2